MCMREQGQVKRFLSIELAEFADARELAALENIWKHISGDTMFHGSYLQARLGELYRPLNQAGDFLRLLALVALLTSALGIYAFSALLSLGQRQEIGIRRALGASRLQILVLMFCRFLMPVIIGLTIFAIPAYLAAIYWLNSYSHRITLGIMPLAVSVLIVSGVGALAVLSHAIRSMLIKPSEALRGS